MQATAPHTTTYRPDTTVVAVGTGSNESPAAAISWGAIIAGAFAAAAMGLILGVLGTGTRHRCASVPHGRSASPAQSGCC